jgi:diguanylate cyclase (GGDEF)-like protein
VLFADVDRFKLANDSLGHQAGDELLVSVAARLRALTRASDTLSRFGGDEFIVLVEDIEGPGDAEDIASRIVQSICEPFVLEGGQTVMLGVSVGIALGGAESSPDDILHDADVAMYAAKRGGTNRYVFFDAVAMGPRSSRKVELEVELERALENHELVNYYQPIIAADTLDIVGAEALVRWNHPTRGLLAPAEFIDLAEETGMIARLGEQVLEQACMQAAAWRDSTGVALQIAVNLSARQFVALDLVDHISAVLKQTRLNPSQLCIEITESLTLQDTEHAIEALLDLKAIGLQLALDDFGTGYASLNYLRRIPVDIVKLDRSFVHDLTVSPVGNAIVGSIIDLARTIGLSVIAEGVETEEEFHRLAEMGCPAVQGHWFAEPMSADELTSRLSTRFETSKRQVLRLGARRAQPVAALRAV